MRPLADAWDRERQHTHQQGPQQKDDEKQMTPSSHGGCQLSQWQHGALKGVPTQGRAHTPHSTSDGAWARQSHHHTSWMMEISTADLSLEITRPIVFSYWGTWRTSLFVPTHTHIQWLHIKPQLAFPCPWAYHNAFSYGSMAAGWLTARLALECRWAASLCHVSPSIMRYALHCLGRLNLTWPSSPALCTQDKHSSALTIQQITDFVHVDFEVGYLTKDEKRKREERKR